MLLKVDRLAIELPMPEEPDPAAAATVQELLGGRFGEMSTGARPSGDRGHPGPADILGGWPESPSSLTAC